MYDWKKLTDAIEYQKSWNTRDCMEDKTLREFAETCEYFELGDMVDVAIATIEGDLYLLIDWEEDDAAEETEKSVAFRIKTINK